MLFAAVVVLSGLAGLCVVAAAGEMATQTWPNTDAAFEQFEQRIAQTHPRNLLARRAC